jgi:hypothetical protein
LHSGTTAEEKQRLSHIVVVGGGPTGVEFSGELSDFIRGDVHRNFGHVKSFVRVTLVEVLTPDLGLSSIMFSWRRLSCTGVDILPIKQHVLFEDVVRL